MFANGGGGCTETPGVANTGGGGGGGYGAAATGSAGGSGIVIIKYGPPSAGYVTMDLDDANNFSLAITTDTTLNMPSHPTPGQSGIITITQGSTPHTLAYDTFWNFIGGVVPDLTATAGAVDLLTYYVESATRATCSLLKNSTR